MILDEVIAITGATRSFMWLDVTNPTPEELDQLALRYNFPAHTVQDCLEPEHLPKFEKLGGMNFLILRTYDDHATSDADTIQELTRKVAVFENQDLVLTIHRSALKFLESVKLEWKQSCKDGHSCQAHHVLLDILRAAMESYEVPMAQNRNTLEDFEVKVFRHEGDSFEDGYYLKRGANTFKRMIRLTLDILPRIADQYKDESALLQDIRERGDRLLYMADEFFDNINNLLNLYLSLSSHRLTQSAHRQNEVMRLLTIFSVFFMPLNLVTGIYGMNFEHMPELKWHYGYYLALGMLGVITLTIGGLFYKMGYFRSSDRDV